MSERAKHDEPAVGFVRSSEIRLSAPGGARADARRAYLAIPAAGRGPGVLVLHEWWGLVPQVRDVCDRLAREGFVALAPDLYRGACTSDPAEARRLMLHLELARAITDLDTAVGALIGHEAVTGPKLGAIGFCMGGQLALLAATRQRRIGAVVDFYGIHPAVTLNLSGLEAAVLGLFGERDEHVPPEAAKRLDAALRDAGKRSAIKIFPGVGHTFFNDARPDVYDATAAVVAWRDTLAFLRAELA